MSKKSRKPNISQDTLARARKELYGGAVVEEEVLGQTPIAAKVATAAIPGKSQPRLVRNVDLAQEYHYVLLDLRNMGMLAVALMVVMTLMSLFI
jgi:hypothetical protein